MNDQLSDRQKQPRRLKKVKGVTIYEVAVKGVQYWRVVSPKPGKGRTARNFRDKCEARNYYERQVQLVRNFGRKAGGGLSDRQRLDAVAALDRLKDFPQVTLLSAVEFYARHHLSLDANVTVSEAISKLLEDKKSDGKSRRYLEDLRDRLARFAEDFGDCNICEVGSGDIGDWLRSLRLAPRTRNTFYLRLGLLFKYAVEQRWALENPVTKSMIAKVYKAKTGILTPEEFSALLTQSGDETRPFWLLGGFAGIRSAEIERLCWSDIDWENRLINIDDAKSKTASERFVDICDALAAWLAPYRGSTGPICPAGLYDRLRADRERAGLTDWPSNALRHSFASYHLAAFKDAAELSLQMGHMTASMVFNHYRQRVRPDIAKLWWEIVPQPAPNVMSLPLSA
jgi:integrase